MLDVRLWLSPPTHPTYWIEPDSVTGWHILLRPCLLQRISCRCRNINLLAIDYAVRPRLRSRLTLGGRAWPRKPEVFGEEDSHLLCRYSCLHLLFHELHVCLPVTLLRAWNAPLPLRRVRSFGIQLSPVISSAQVHLTSELLRFLSRMAASKPTSWLSGRSHILYHSAEFGDLRWRSGLFPFCRWTLSPSDCLPRFIPPAFRV